MISVAGPDRTTGLDAASVERNICGVTLLSMGRQSTKVGGRKSAFRRFTSATPPGAEVPRRGPDLPLGTMIGHSHPSCEFLLSGRSGPSRTNRFTVSLSQTRAYNVEEHCNLCGQDSSLSRAFTSFRLAASIPSGRGRAAETEISDRRRE